MVRIKIIIIIAILSYIIFSNFINKKNPQTNETPSTHNQVSIITEEVLSNENSESNNTSINIIEEQPKEPSLLAQLFNEFHAINNDTVGFIEMDYIGVSYPVMYSNVSNEYYLYKDYNGNYSGAGSIYLDTHSNGTWGKINLIHGHNMSDTTMFSNLFMLNNQDFFDNSSKIIKIYDGEKDREYEIFAINVVDANVTTVPLFYENPEDYEQWLNYSLEKSTVSGGEINNKEDILVLNTCDYLYDNGRLLVLASRID